MILAASYQADLAKKGIDLQFAGHMPSLDMIGNLDFIDTSRPNGISYKSQYIGAQLKIPIFAGGGINSRVDQARFQFEAATEQVDVQRRAVKLQVKNSFRKIIAAIGQIHALDTAISSSQVALEAEQAGFEVGTRTMVDVLVVLRNLYANKRDYAKAVYDYIVESFTLKQGASLIARQDIESGNGWLTTARAEIDPLLDPRTGGGNPSDLGAPESQLELGVRLESSPVRAAPLMKPRDSKSGRIPDPRLQAGPSPPF